ncbi:MAG: hypothetical protein GF393_06045 [Armatimonadia bacterium]|nr:hypothetical protein [Armatimonadia bacterium]
MTIYRLFLASIVLASLSTICAAQQPDEPLRRPVVFSYNCPWGSDVSPNEAWTDPWFMDFDRVRLSTANMVDHIPVEAFVEHWRTPDRRILARTRAGGEDTTVEELVAEWDAALSAEGIDGMACDELIGKYATAERIAVWIPALWEIRRRHPDKVLAFWTDSGLGRVRTHGAAHDALLVALRNYADFVMPEIYYRESTARDFADTDDAFPLFREKVEEWEAAAPGITPKILMGLGTVQNVDWGYDDVPEIDYGEFLAKQVQVCATDPVLREMAGLALYAPGYLKPATLTAVNDAIIEHYGLGTGK